MIAFPSYIATQAAPRKGGAGEAGTAHPGSASRASHSSLTPDGAAVAILRGLKAKKRLLTVGRLAWASYWVNRIAPRAFELAMLRQTRGEVD